jgi:glutamate dehydrogenase (NADP+)
MSVFNQISTEISSSLDRIFKKYPENKKLFDFLISPERIICFKVSWQDRNGEIKWNTGYRVQFNSALGPYKGGLRFNKNVNEDILKALSLEQTFKNSLTGLHMGGGKGGSDFDPVNKTENEIRNFCQSFMRELYKFIGPNIDIPAGDIGVGSKEIGYMYGEYKKMTNEFAGSLTGKGILWGGSQLRPEATGYGVVYFLENMLNYKNDILKNKNIIVTGCGNVAIFTMEKLLDKEANVVAISDISGCLSFKDKLTSCHLEIIKKLYDERKTLLDGMIELSTKDCTFDKSCKPWFVQNIKADIVLPCATQNEIDENDARRLVDIGCKYIAEGSNMSSTIEAIDYFIDNNVFFGPSKACNSGGVAVSGLEMMQNSSRIFLSRDEVNSKLYEIMKNVFNTCLKVGEEYLEQDENINKILLLGSNIAGFLKISQAMKEQGMF